MRFNVSSGSGCGPGPVSVLKPNAPPFGVEIPVIRRDVIVGAVHFDRRRPLISLVTVAPGFQRWPRRINGLQHRIVTRLQFRPRQFILREDQVKCSDDSAAKELGRADNSSPNSSRLRKRSRRTFRQIFSEIILPFPPAAKTDHDEQTIFIRQIIKPLGCCPRCLQGGSRSSSSPSCIEFAPPGDFVLAQQQFIRPAPRRDKIFLPLTM